MIQRFVHVIPAPMQSPQIVIHNLGTRDVIVEACPFEKQGQILGMMYSVQDENTVVVSCDPRITHIVVLGQMTGAEV